MAPVCVSTLENHPLGTSPWHLFTRLLNKYRIAGKFGGKKVWQIHCYERLVRKSLANG